jgi:hypothetical protein
MVFQTGCRKVEFGTPVSEKKKLTSEKLRLSIKVPVGIFFDLDPGSFITSALPNELHCQ